MSVYIIHNGRSCSDKRVYFVEPTPAEEHVFSELLACYAKAWPRGLPSDLLAEPPNGPVFGSAYLMAKVEQADWFVGRCSVPSFVEDLEFLIGDECADVEAAKRCITLMQTLLGTDAWSMDYDCTRRAA